MFVTKVGKGIAAISALRGFQSNWIDSMMKARDSFPDAYLQAINSERILNEDHLLLSLYNVLMAHEHGYAKMKRIDTELLLNISGTNNFEDALADLAPKEGDNVFVVSYSDDEKAAGLILDFFTKQAGAKGQSLKSSEEKLRNLMMSTDFRISGRISEEEILPMLIESSAMFYVRYR